MKTNTLTKSNFLFERITNKYIAKEDDPYTLPYFFVIKTGDGNYRVHHLDGNRLDIIIDSLKIVNIF